MAKKFLYQAKMYTSINTDLLVSIASFLMHYLATPPNNTFGPNISLYHHELHGQTQKVNIMNII